MTNWFVWGLILFAAYVAGAKYPAIAQRIGLA